MKKLCVLLLLFFCSATHSASYAQTTIMTTVVNVTNSGGYAGDGGPALLAYIHGVFQVAGDTLGNLYLCDQFNNCIRKVDTAGLANAYGAHANAVCSPANQQGQQLSFYTWAERSTTTLDYEVFWKLANTTYAFKQSPQVAESQSQTPNWHIYPNPANDGLVVSVAAATGMTYVVTDMTGRTLQQGEMRHDKTNIDVRELAAGTYAIKLYSGGTANGQMLFVKN